MELELWHSQIVAGDNESQIKLVEDYVKANSRDVFVYSGPIMYRPAADFVDLICRKETKQPNVLLFLSTPGGDPHAAYRMIRALRRSYRKVRLAVLGPCKSAGTLIAIGAHELAMYDTGELGPLDVQLAKPDEIIPNSSGLDVFQALAVTTEQAFSAFEQAMIDLVEHSSGSISTKTSAEIAKDIAVGLFAPITEQIDPNRLGEVQRAIKIAYAYADRLSSPNLKQGAMKKLVEDYPSHGFVIDMEEAKQLFQVVERIEGAEGGMAAIFRAVLRHSVVTPKSMDVGATFSSPPKSAKPKETKHAGSPRRRGRKNLQARTGNGAGNGTWAVSPEAAEGAGTSSRKSSRREARRRIAAV